MKIAEPKFLPRLTSDTAPLLSENTLTELTSFLKSPVFVNSVKAAYFFRWMDSLEVDEYRKRPHRLNDDESIELEIYKRVKRQEDSFLRQLQLLGNDYGKALRLNEQWNYSDANVLSLGLAKLKGSDGTGYICYEDRGYTPGEESNSPQRLRWELTIACKVGGDLYTEGDRIFELYGV